MRKKKVLIISHDKIGASMAGPGIRYHYMATALGDSFDVTVGFFDPSYLPGSSFEHSYAVQAIDASSFEATFAQFDTIIALWLSESMVDFCNRRGIFVVFDIYAPGPVENLSLLLYGNKAIEAQEDYAYERSIHDFIRFFQTGDLFLFSNRRQLNYWVGFVFGSDQVRPSNYLQRPLFERFIYAPMGIDKDTNMSKRKPVLRDGKRIKKTDSVLLWTGGIWNWFDAQTLVKAMRKLRQERPDIKLVFLGTQHPNPDVPAMKEASDTVALAKKYGLYGKTIFIHDGWIPYAERIPYLLEADAAISVTKPSIETEFSHRTRVLDHILAALPTISTQGDYLSDEAIASGLGITVPPSDVDALVEAIKKVIDKKENRLIRKNILAVQQSYYWDVTLDELHKFLANNPEKLKKVKVTKTRETPRYLPLRRIISKILPRPLKNVIIRVLQYGQ